MSDPVARLNAALEGRYTIERELGDSSSSRVPFSSRTPPPVRSPGPTICLLARDASLALSMPLKKGDSA